jgi:ABC-type amino acid transport substrate-binding protein
LDCNAKLKDFKDEPWSYRDGNRWIGFCVDLMQKLSEMLKIEITPIRINDMGSRVPNTVDVDGPPSFTGVIGQVYRGVRLTALRINHHTRVNAKLLFQDVDIIAAPIPVTTDKDDYINFVEPYFERNGLIIGML